MELEVVPETVVPPPREEEEEQQELNDEASYLEPLYEKVEDLLPYVQPYGVATTEASKALLDVLVQVERRQSKYNHFL